MSEDGLKTIELLGHVLGIGAGVELIVVGGIFGHFAGVELITIYRAPRFFLDNPDYFVWLLLR